LIGLVNEARSIAKQAIGENRQIKESAQRSQIESRLLGALPPSARSKMKTLLEASAVADMEKTFKKFAPAILSEAKQGGTRPASQEQFNEHALTMRNGNGRAVVAEGDDDDEIANIRRLAFGTNRR